MFGDGNTILHYDHGESIEIDFLTQYNTAVQWDPLNIMFFVVYFIYEFFQFQLLWLTELLPQNSTNDNSNMKIEH